VRAADVYDPTIGAPDKVNSRRACFIEDFTPDFDSADVSVPADILFGLDRLFQLTLHAGVQAFRDAVTNGLDRSRAGVILGSIALPTSRASDLSREWLGCTFGEKVLGEGARRPGPVAPLNRYVCGLPAALLAKTLGLGGGSFTVDAACASSLYALKLAVDELLSGRADAMLTGGVCCADSLYTQMGFSQLRALSPSGVCSPFDARADGLVVGEGAGILVLKRVEDALRAGDHIYGVVRGIGLSNDVGGSLLAPLSEGQLRAMRAAYAQAGWAPQDVDLVECHATGTPVGDAVEFEGLKTLWGDAGQRVGQCVIGSVKSNVGHLLTGAGAAALIKVLLALKEKTLPPTANFCRPIANLGMDASPFSVLTHAAPWEKRDAATPRRAAVSAFGFGGVNAHVLVEEWGGGAPDIAAQENQTIQLESSEPVAVVGMAAHFGPWRSLRRFQERVLGGGDIVEPAASGRWWGVDQSAWFRERDLDQCPFKGFYVHEVSIRLDRFRVPPKELEEMLPQQLLLLDVAADAVEDAGLDRQDNLNTGVFVALGLDMNTTNFAVRWTLANQAAQWARALGFDLSEEELDDWVDALREVAGPPLTANRTMGALASIAASRVAREFRCGASSFTLSSEETSGIRALEAAVRALRKGEIDKAIVGAVDLAGDVRAALAAHSVRAYSASGVARPMDVAADGPLVGEGAGAVVLKRLGDALRDGDRVYAVIKGIGAAAGGGVDQAVPLSGAYRSALQRAYAEAGVAPESVGYLETHGSGDASEDAMEAQALAAFFTREDGGAPCALGSVKADIGHAGAASGLASLIKACLCLYQEVVPPLRHCDAPRPELSARDASFRVPRSPQYWLRNRAEGPRRAGVSAFGFDGNCAHVVLEALENEAARFDPTERLQPLGAREEALFAVEANNVAALSVELNRLRAHVEHAPDANIEGLARLWWKENGEEPQKHRAVAFVARSGGDLLKQIAFVQQWLAETPDRRIGADEDVAWPIYVRDRVFYAPEPLGPSGKTAFVYPGSGNYYPDMGRDVAVQWPEIHRKQDVQNQFLRAQYQPERFWDTGSLDPVEDDHRAAIFGQVALATAVTDLIQEFGIRCEAVIGYSLGESAGLFALRAWADRDEMLRRMNSSTLFTTDLVGRYDAARKAWGLPPSKTVDWVLGIINRPSKAVLAALKDHKRVYRLIVNTLQESVIGGDRSAVERLVKKLECEFFPLTGVSSVHCEVARQVEKPYRELHLFETTPPRGVTFYSGATGRAYPVTRESAADAILAQAVHGVDFPKVVNAAYKDGIRFFIEMGPGASCSRMIDTILEGRPHVARSACVSGQGAVSSVLRLLAQLIAERAPVELAALYGQETRVVAHQAASEEVVPPTLTVPVGGEPFVVPLPEVRVRVFDARDVSVEPSLPTEYAKAVPVEAAAVRVAERHPLTTLVKQMTDAQSAKTQAHEAYLRFAERTRAAMTENLALQTSLMAAMAASGDVSVSERPSAAASTAPTAFDRQACMEFAVGKIGNVLGSDSCAAAG
jgi:acyl transferase domain-containing protein